MRELLKFFIGLPIGTAILVVVVFILYVAGLATASLGIFPGPLEGFWSLILSGFVGLTTSVMILSLVGSGIYLIYSLGDYVMGRGK